MPTFVSRGGLKLEHALSGFDIPIAQMICADLGCNAGGFTDCLLQRGAARVYAVDTGYGMLEWVLRKDPRVIVMERTNAMHVTLPEKIDVVVIDVAWTRQRHILPAARRLLRPGGAIISLLKPHYEAASADLRKGVLPLEAVAPVIERVKHDITSCGLEMRGIVESPVRGAKGNQEFLVWLTEI